MSGSSGRSDLAFGIIGTLTIIPIILGVVIFILPSTRLNAYEKEMADTRDYLSLLERQGNSGVLLKSAYFQKWIERLEKEGNALRNETYVAATAWQQMKAACCGLSRKLYDLQSMVKELRSDISTTASQDASEGQHDEEEHSENTACVEPSVSSNVAGTHVAVPTDMTTPVCTSSTSFASSSTPSISPDTSDTVEPGDSATSMVDSHSGTPIHEVKKLHTAKKFRRRTKRYLAARSYDLSIAATMEFRKDGIIRSNDYKRALLNRTIGSISSSSTFVSSGGSNTLPLYVAPPSQDSCSDAQRESGWLCWFRRPH